MTMTHKESAAETVNEEETLLMGVAFIRALLGDNPTLRIPRIRALLAVADYVDRIEKLRNDPDSNSVKLSAVVPGLIVDNWRHSGDGTKEHSQHPRLLDNLANAVKALEATQGVDNNPDTSEQQQQG